MKQLLNYQENRIINILKELTIYRYFMTLKEIQEMNQCSDRTVLNDLKFIETFHDPKLEFNTIGDTVSLKHRSIGNLRFVYQQILNQSNHVNILLSIFFNPYQSIDFHAENAHISASHAQRSLSNIQAFLNEHSASLSKHKGYYYINAKSELTLRFLLTDFLVDVRSLRQSFPDQKTMVELLQRLKTEISQYDLFLDELHLNHLNLFFYVSILRESQGFELNSKTLFGKVPIHSNVLTESQIQAGLEAIKIIGQSYLDNKALKNEILNEVQIFLTEQKFNTDIYNEKVITESIYQLLILKKHYNGHPKAFLRRSKMYGEKFRLQNKLLSDKIGQAVFDSQYEFTETIARNIDEIIFWVSMEIPDFIIPVSKKILVLSDFGDNHAYDLQLFVRNHFTQHTICSKGILNGISPDLKNEIETNQYDIIISTTYLDILHQGTTVHINDYPNETDLLEIYRAINY
ncbi:helix-turn-helix domain-containing protein [Erysipelothrix urinaevulpis]|uniref:helix-turn-helix domain-containing protein n=1 Tax=Erysipelothrix urinaevulpis TaxID=2683717 RepID=UPI00135A3CB9|nr:helix-turn-helix domain-containing protein [Erysipelothrix urinaevulpis]